MTIWSEGASRPIMVPGERTTEYSARIVRLLCRGVGAVRLADCPISRGKGGVTEKRIVNCVTGVSG
jgi:hypothetical protein